MTYHRGTLEEFNTWHDTAKITEGITAEGKIGFIGGVPAPNNQRTMAYSEVIQNPDSSDDYIWAYGDYAIAERAVLNQTDVNDLNWFPVTQ